MRSINFMQKIALLILSILSICSTTYAQEARKYSNEFLNLGAGARAMGMANAQIASVNDLTAGYWNPAGLMHLESDFQASFMHAEYFAGIAKYDYGAFATKLSNGGSLGLSILRFGVDDIPNTTQLIDSEGRIDYNRISSFSAVDYGFLLSYAQNLGVEGLSVGGNAKIIYRQVGNFARAFGFGLDAGLQYHKNGWNLGAMARDVTSTYNAWSYTLDEETIDVFTQTGNEIPSSSIEITLPRLIIGVGRDFRFNDDFNLLAEFNLDMPFDGRRNTLVSTDLVSFDPMFGFEAGYKNLVFLRGGIGNFQQIRAEIGNYNTTTFMPNFGVGLKLKGVNLDYALTNIGNFSGALYSNIFSLRIDFFRSNS